MNAPERLYYNIQDLILDMTDRPGQSNSSETGDFRFGQDAGHFYAGVASVIDNPVVCINLTQQFIMSIINSQIARGNVTASDEDREEDEEE